MTAPAIPAHRCNADPFAVCACGRPGSYAFGPRTRPVTEWVVEESFEFVERLPDSQTFTENDVFWHCRKVVYYRHFSSAIVAKALRIMEHHGLIRRQQRSRSRRGRPIIWARALPVGAAS